MHCVYFELVHEFCVSFVNLRIFNADLLSWSCKYSVRSSIYGKKSCIELESVKSIFVHLYRTNPVERSIEIIKTY